MSSLQYIKKPLQENPNKGAGKDAMLLLKHNILKKLLLRRTKKERAAELALPMKTVSSVQHQCCEQFNSIVVIFLTVQLVTYFWVQVTLRKDSLNDKERDFYMSFHNKSKAQFDTYAISLIFHFQTRALLPCKFADSLFSFLFWLHILFPCLVHGISFLQLLVVN